MAISSYESPYSLAPGSARQVLRETPTLAHDLARSDTGGTGYTRQRAAGQADPKPLKDGIPTPPADPGRTRRTEFRGSSA